MDNQQPQNFDKKLIYGLSVGVVLGALVIFVVFMIGNFRIVRITDINKLVPGDEISGIDIPKFLVSDIDSSGKNLCEILGVGDINTLISGLGITRAEEDPEHPFSNCNYFTAQGGAPVAVFADSLASIEVSRRMQEELGADIEELTGIGDEAFLTSNKVITDRSVTMRGVTFRVGSFVYSVSSSVLNEGQLRTIVAFVAGKLR